MIILGVFAGVWIIVLAVCVALSFSVNSTRIRNGCRVASWMLGAPLTLVALVLGTLRVAVWFAEPPSLSNLQSHFHERHADLDALVQMSNSDTGYPRVHPDYLARIEADDRITNFAPTNSAVGFTLARWDAYRRIFRRNGIKLGIDRDRSGDSFIMMDSIGLLNRGYITGYVHCTQPSGDSSVDFRYHPCQVNQDQGFQKYNADPRVMGYSFRRLEGDWFVYKEGPS